MSIEYRVVKELPRPVRKALGSDYDEIINRFLGDEKAKYAEVSRGGTQAISLASYLKSRIKEVLKVEDKIWVKVINKKVYLVKIEEKSK